MDSEGIGKAKKSSARPMIIFSVASLLFTIFIYTQQDHHSWTLYVQLARHDAGLPFQFRILFPALVNGLKWMLPFLDLESAYYFLTFVLTFGLLSVYRKFLGLFRAHVGSLVPLLILYPLFWNHSVLHGLFVPSDLAALFFLTAGLVLIYRKKWLYFYALYILAVFNRETAIYLTLAMIVTAGGRMKAKQVILHTLAQLCLWTSIKYLLLVVYSDGMDGLYLDSLTWNLKYFEDLVTLKNGAIFWVTLFGLIWIPGLTRWKTQPVFVRRLFYVLIPAFGAMFFAGQVMETRVFTDLVVVVTTPTALLLLDRSDRPPASG